MLAHLSIKNYALIEELEIEFPKGFSVITGETGAGKSILLGALSLILGQRADLQSLKDKSKKCIVEGTFNIKNIKLKEFFKNNDIDFEHSSILRREILPSGKSRAFVNDTPVNLNILKELAEKLVNIHSQNKTTTLQDVDFQLTVLDNFAGHFDHLDKYRSLFIKYKKLFREINDLKADGEKARAEQDYIKFQFEELESANLIDGELEEIEKEIEILDNAEEIKSKLTNSIGILSDENGLLEMFNKLILEIRPVKKYLDLKEDLETRLTSNYLDVKDVSEELERLQEKIEVNPGRLEKLNERLNTIYHLQQKHRASDIGELMKIKENFARKIDEYISLDKKIADTQKQIKETENNLKELAKLISKKRRSTIPALERQIKNMIGELGMSKADFKIEQNILEKLSYDGIDKIKFMFSANPGSELKEISKIASGGELSRLMLSIKSLVAKKKIISTIIFDEIDTGVSGEIAGKMGSIMRRMSENMQILTITHLPQIAAKGIHHYYIFKREDKGATKSFIKKLNENERVGEIAKMLSDARVTSSAVETARDLLLN